MSSWLSLLKIIANAKHTSQCIRLTNVATRYNTMCTVTNKKRVSYTDLLQAQMDDSVLIIDVREGNEINETGKLPGSVHIPMGDVVDTLVDLPDIVFKDRFNTKKPQRDTKIILSCRSGKRSEMVQGSLQQLGYQNVYNYSGGWLEWEDKQKA